MLTGPELGAAIESARIKKNVSKKALAEAFGVTPPSVQDWVRRGSIGKEKLPKLWAYFEDVVGPDHWGLEEFPPLPKKAIGIAAGLRALMDEATPTATVRRLQRQLLMHSATRRRLIGSLLMQLAEKPGDEEIAAELAQQLETNPAQKTAAA